MRWIQRMPRRSGRKVRNWSESPFSDFKFQSCGLRTRVAISSGNQALTRCAFVATNPTEESITSGLPGRSLIDRPLLVPPKNLFNPKGSSVAYRTARNVTLLVPFSWRLCARLWRERDKRPTMKRTIVLSANPRPNVFESHGFENSSCTRGLLRGLQADATFRHYAASGRARRTHIHTGASRCAAARNFIVKHTPTSPSGRISGRAAKS